MALFESRKKKELKSHFVGLVAMATVDGDVDDSERDIAIAMGINLGLTEKDIKDALKHPDRYKMIVPKDPNDRMHMLHDLVVIMLSDGEIHENEMDFCIMCAQRLGFRPTMVHKLMDHIITAARENAELDVDADEFLGTD